jgi:ectoine hydroxylase-related dioxygenase (phytanoyl-CoA dioxygenase family)
MTVRYTEAELAEFTDFYEEHGAVRLPGLVEPEWVERILGEIDRAAAAYESIPEPERSIRYGRGKGRMTIRHQWRNNPVIREFLFRDALMVPLARIARCRILQFWFDLTFIHEAASEGTAGHGSDWHHDIAAFAFKGEKLPSLWMAMTPATRELSRIEFIDGSHRTVAGYYSPPTGGRPDDGMLEVPDFNALIERGKERVLTWDCDPGDAIIIHPYTIHGAKGNSGTAGHRRRVAMTTRWLGDDVRWLPIDPKLAKSAFGLNGAPPPVGARPPTASFPVVWQA